MFKNCILPTRPRKSKIKKIEDHVKCILIIMNKNEQKGKKAQDTVVIIAATN
ncbi:23190_t:CDS:2 [Dentiscutata erythropus]|uniref:23190_t:CDS:1 n=1 Tax=Dentiscutata erythropus TaxID=1348616 RepID=A0A9N9FVZ8_9GLOM|nr:23190_t:CDS:2 [Dentiscutata erythropus]